MPDQSAGPQPLRDILEERGERYGNFQEHAEFVQGLMAIMSGQADWITTLEACARRRIKWLGLSDDQRQALTVIVDKIARTLNGDPTYADNWVDIAGYATLVADRLQKDYPQP